MNINYELNDTWKFKYKSSTNYSKKQTTDNWLSMYKHVYDINDIKTFWCVINNIYKISRVRPGTIYSFFKDDIEPCWEHSKNKNGFSLIIYLYYGSVKNRKIRNDFNKKMDELYINTLIHLISNNKKIHKYINGVTIDKKNVCYKLTWWINSEYKESKNKNIEEYITNFINFEKVKEYLQKYKEIVIKTNKVNNLTELKK